MLKAQKFRIWILDLEFSKFWICNFGFAIEVYYSGFIRPNFTIPNLKFKILFSHLYETGVNESKFHNPESQILKSKFKNSKSKL